MAISSQCLSLRLALISPCNTCSASSVYLVSSIRGSYREYDVSSPSFRCLLLALSMIERSFHKARCGFRWRFISIFDTRFDAIYYLFLARRDTDAYNASLGSCRNMQNTCSENKILFVAAAAYRVLYVTALSPPHELIILRLQGLRWRKSSRRHNLASRLEPSSAELIIREP
jgi:hypothetical protein